MGRGKGRDKSELSKPWILRSTLRRLKQKKKNLE
jgi:hypothetical protein